MQGYYKRNRHFERYLLSPDLTACDFFLWGYAEGPEYPTSETSVSGEGVSLPMWTLLGNMKGGSLSGESDRKIKRDIQGYYKRNRHFQRYVVSPDLTACDFFLWRYAEGPEYPTS